MPIRDLIKETCEDLINLYHGHPARTKFCFPSSRLSEQEARFCFAASVERGKVYRYAVETPTRYKYRFKGKGSRRAQTDLSLWSLDCKNQLINIEFKANNPSYNNIDKDIQKLLKETPEAVWFHLLLNANAGTFPTLAQKFTVAVDKHSKICLKVDPTWKKKILFVVCSVVKGVGMAGELSLLANVTDIKVFFDDGATFLLDSDMRTKGNWQVLVRDREL